MLATVVSSVCGLKKDKQRSRHMSALDLDCMSGLVITAHVLLIQGGAWRHMRARGRGHVTPDWFAMLEWAWFGKHVPSLPLGTQRDDSRVANLHTSVGHFNIDCHINAVFVVTLFFFFSGVPHIVISDVSVLRIQDYLSTIITMYL